MTPEELAAVVADYAHRSDLTSQIEDQFIEYTRLRIGRDLRAMENELSVEIEPLENPADLPSDFSSMRQVEFFQERGPVTLKSAGWHFIDRIDSRTGLGGKPRWYATRGSQIEFRPFVEGTYRLTYFAIPELVAGVSSDSIAAFPTIWIQGALIELHTWTQDMEQRKASLDTYLSEVKLANQNAERGRYDAPAVKGV